MIAEEIIDAIAAALPGSLPWMAGEKPDRTATVLKWVDNRPIELAYDRIVWELEVAADIYVIDFESEWSRVLHQHYAAAHAAIMAEATYAALPVEYRNARPEGGAGEPESTTETDDTVVYVRVPYVVEYVTDFYDLTRGPS